MLSIKDKGLLLQIIKRGERINNKINNLSFNCFLSNEDIKEIICFNIFQIGELANNLSDEFVKEYNKIPWKHVRGMRNRIVHGYDTIDYEIIWNTAENSIKELVYYCREILNNQ